MAGIDKKNAETAGNGWIWLDLAEITGNDNDNDDDHKNDNDDGEESNGMAYISVIISDSVLLKR